MVNPEIPQYRCDDNDYDDESRAHIKHYRGRKTAGIICALAPVIATASFAMPFWDKMRDRNKNGPLVEETKFCREIPEIEMSPTLISPLLQPLPLNPSIARTIEVEQEFKDITSAAENFEAKEFNIIRSLSMYAKARLSIISEFTSKYSGARIVVHSDTDDAFSELDDDILDDLAHSSLNRRVAFDHVGVEAFMECLTKLIIDDSGPRLLEGKTVHVYIPSKPGVCYVNGYVEEVPVGAKTSEFCDSMGGTIYDAYVNAGYKRLRESWVSFMTTRTKESDVERKMSVMAVHEFIHLFGMVGELPFKIVPNEAMVEYVTRETIESLYRDGLPDYMSYPSGVYMCVFRS